MGPSPVGDASSWLIEKAIELATFLVGGLALLWKAASRATKIESELGQLKEQVTEQAAMLEKITQRQDLRHEQNLNAIYSRPDKADFQRFQDQIMQQLSDLKHALAGR